MVRLRPDPFAAQRWADGRARQRAFGAAILPANPQGTLDRQAQQKTAAPTAGTLSSRRVLAPDGPDRLTRSTGPDSSPPVRRAGATRPASSRLSLAAGGHTHRRRAPARRSGREEARVLQVRNPGAQRASSHRTVRLLALPILAMIIAVGGLSASATPASAAGVKVVVVVGPVESSTAKYIRSAKKYAALARSHGANVVEVYSPRATWAKVKAAAKGANIFIYLGHGNGHPSPYGAFYADRKDGLGLNKASGQGQQQPQVLRRVLRQDGPRPGPQRRRHPEPPVLRLGQLGVGSCQPDQGRRQAASRQLRRGLPARRRQGGLRQRHRQRLVDHPHALDDEHDRWARSSRRIRHGPGTETSHSRRLARPVTGSGWIHTPRVAYYHSLVGNFSLTAAQVRAG